jgi:hypothetical protein
MGGKWLRSGGGVKTWRPSGTVAHHDGLKVARALASEFEVLRSGHDK